MFYFIVEMHGGLMVILDCRSGGLGVNLARVTVLCPGQDILP